MSEAAWENLHKAALELAKPSALKQRLTDAFTRYLIDLPPQDMPSEARQDFEALRTKTGAAGAAYFAFDMLELDGRDLRPLSHELGPVHCFMNVSPFCRDPVRTPRRAVARSEPDRRRPAPRSCPAPRAPKRW